MNLVDASLRAIPIGIAAAIVIGIAKWRGKPLAAKFEHALWLCVLIAMLAFALPKITVRAGAPITPAALHYTAPPATLAVIEPDLPVISTPQAAAAPIAWPSVWSFAGRSVPHG